MARVTLIANWAMIAARTVVRTVWGTAGMMIATQSAAKIVSAPKLAANATRPTSVTSLEARLSVREKRIGHRIVSPAFFAVNAAKQIVNTVWPAFGFSQNPERLPRGAPRPKGAAGTFTLC